MGTVPVPPLHRLAMCPAVGAGMLGRIWLLHANCGVLEG